MELEYEYRSRIHHVFNEVKKRLVCKLVKRLRPQYTLVCVVDLRPSVIYCSF